MFEYRAFLSCNKEPLRGHDSTQDLVASMEAEAMVAKVGFFINFILIIMIIMEAEAMVAKVDFFINFILIIMIIMEAEGMVAKVGFISSSTIFIAFCSSS